MIDRIIAHYNEIALKGGNRNFFERQLQKNIEQSLSDFGIQRVERLDGRIIAIAKQAFSEEEKTRAIAQCKKIFGIASFSFAVNASADIDRIEAAARKLAAEKKFSSFAVRSKRADKRFPLTSEEVNRIIGATIQQSTGARVNLTNPEVTLSIEITSKEAYLSIERFDGPGGLPVGTAGKVIALLSGGIDSPVAAWQVMKRGCEVIFLHFHSYPHTSKASIEKVKELAQIVGAYQPRSKLYLVPFAEAQREMVMRTDEAYRILLYRRLMMRIANTVARTEGAEALVTGESIGQVASQTLPNIRAVEDASELPVFRPLIGDDKTEIIAKARRIGTFDISIRPHDDCCSLFVPKHPATAATVSALQKEEEKISMDTLAHDALTRAEIETW